MKVTNPSAMNETFARAFNSRSLDNLLSLYEPDAALRVDASTETRIGLGQIAETLRGLLQIPGTMVSKNNFCVARGDLALLRADWALVADDGRVVASASTAEIVRRQADGTWLYVVDHAAGASLPPVDLRG
jgi:ketosteroid isomerase-like protein